MRNGSRHRLNKLCRTRYWKTRKLENLQATRVKPANQRNLELLVIRAVRRDVIQGPCERKQKINVSCDTDVPICARGRAGRLARSSGLSQHEHVFISGSSRPARGPWPSSAPAPDSNQRQAAAGAGDVDTARRGVPGEVPLARPWESERAAAGAADPLRHLTAGNACDGKRTGQARFASVELIFQFSLNFYDHV